MSEFMEFWINNEKNPIKKFIKRLINKCLTPILREIDKEFRNVGLITEQLDKRIVDFQINQERLELLWDEDKIQMSKEFSEHEDKINDLIGQNIHRNEESNQILKRILEIENSLVENYSCIDYFDFENHFRGSREDIKNRQTIYLPYFMEKSNVYDLGCGRGEFVELLTENQIGVTGIDLYQEFVNYCQSINLNVVYGDAIEILDNVRTVDGIFLGQVVEHMPIQQVAKIFEMAYEKLEEDCYIIAETPNPMSLAIFTQSFYIDPSHNKPVHPYLLRYLAQKAGFRSVELIFTEASKYPVKIPELKSEDMEIFNVAMNIVSETLFGSQDYALIARK